MNFSSTGTGAASNTNEAEETQQDPPEGNALNSPGTQETEEVGPVGPDQPGPPVENPQVTDESEVGHDESDEDGQEQLGPGGSEPLGQEGTESTNQDEPESVVSDGSEPLNSEQEGEQTDILDDGSELTDQEDSPVENIEPLNPQEPDSDEDSDNGMADETEDMEPSASTSEIESDLPLMSEMELENAGAELIEMLKRISHIMSEKAKTIQEKVSDITSEEKAMAVRQEKLEVAAAKMMELKDQFENLLQMIKDDLRDLSGRVPPIHETKMSDTQNPDLPTDKNNKMDKKPEQLRKHSSSEDLLKRILEKLQHRQ
ncbi:hypothetical protein SNE40_016998 [Patella caerulea]|uniref:Uncharacterized protein n=1 Tax=Patella caerulea TaxID=87958 RepID=A0AAN8JD15_PATCE